MYHLRGSRPARSTAPQCRLQGMRRERAMMDGSESLFEKWRRFRSRPPEDRRLILRAALILPLTEAGLRCFGFHQWKELIETFSLPANRPQRLAREALYEKGLRAARAVGSVELHGPMDPNCLERSMTLWWILRLDGIDGELHIGARKQEGELEAHAWVELSGRVLNDGAEVHQDYALFDSPIAPGAAVPRGFDRPKSGNA